MENEKINYIEIPAKDLEITKQFFVSVFNYSFKDYGKEYTSFSNAGIKGGFYKSLLNVSTSNGSILIVFYSKDLDRTKIKIEAAGGKVIKQRFSFPGGSRFHFCDPNNNEYAVWSDR